MKLKKFYEVAVTAGINTDPRGPAIVQKELENMKKRHQELSSKEKPFFDKEQLTNPYADTRILFGSGETEVKTVMVGIDIDTSELLLIDRLNARGKEKIDLAMSHHPQGSAFASFYEVMGMQADIFASLGVAINIGEKMVEERKREVARKIHAANHERSADAARLLGIPYLCVHTPADNHVVHFLTNLMEHKKPHTLGEILDILEGIEEYKISKEHNVGPHLLNGSRLSRAGKIFVDMTGGTEGPKSIFERLSLAGIGTIIGMHFSEEHTKELKEKNINCIVAGHSASDNLGMNLLLDEIEKIQKIKILACSGFRRVQRGK